MKTRIIQTISLLLLVTIFICAASQPALVWAYAPANAAPSAQANIRAAAGEQATNQLTGPIDPHELETFLDTLLAEEMAENHIPGAVIAVVEDGRTLLAKGYGYADVEKRAPVDAERTLFRVASISKLFTWTAVMQLLEQGKLSLDDDVNGYLDFSIPATFPEPIRLRHLLSHTPGFEDKNLNMNKLAAQQVNPLGVYLEDNVPARVFPPGEVMAYSNYGATLAGYIVQRISGLSFDEYVERNIFGPLGMAHSTFRQPLPDSLAADMASGYNYTGGKYVAASFVFDQAYPGGSLSATAADIARFMIAHLRNGELDGQRILQDATARQMHTQLYTPDPRVEGVAYGFFEKTINGQRLISHGGNLITFNSFLYLIPGQNNGFFISTNSTSGSAAIQPVVEGLLDYLYPVPKMPPPEPVAGFDQRIAHYIGPYSRARNSFTSFEKIEKLFSPIGASLDDDGTLKFSTSRFTEVEPGLLQDVDEPDNKLIYYNGSEGRLMVFGSVGVYEPFTLFRTPWYGTGGLHLLIVVSAAVMFLGAMIAWPVRAINGRRNRTAFSQITPVPARLARWSAALFGLLLLVSLIGFAAIFADILPGFGVPRIYFEIPLTLNMLLVLSLVLAGLALAMLVFAALAWVRRYWSLVGRIFYTALALLALLVTWALVYWDLLL